MDEMSGLQTPPGFQLIVLPYADDIRDLDSIMEAAGYPKAEEDGPGPSIIDKLRPEEKNAARLLIKNLTIDFDVRNFENPTIQKFYSGLQALALNEDEPEEVEDLLEPNYKEMQRFQPVINKFKSAFFEGDDSDAEAISQQAKPKARGVGRGARGGASQSSKTSAANGTKGGGRGRKATKAKPAAEPINETCLEDSDNNEEVKQPVQKRRKVGQDSSNIPVASQTSQRSLRSRSRNRGQNPESQESGVK